MRATVAMVSRVLDTATGSKGWVPDITKGSNSLMKVTEEPVTRLPMEEKIYVAVGRDEESKSTLIWALHKSGGKDFCIFYVNQMIQASTTSMKRRDEQKRVHRKERDKAHKVLDKYLRISQQIGVRAEKMYIEMDTIENGILQLIYQQSVKKLVMGAASDRNYSMNMSDLKSKKAIYVRQHAPTTCHICFPCNGYLICTRSRQVPELGEPVKDNSNVESAPSRQPVGWRVPQAQSTSSDQDSARSVQSDVPSRRSRITSGTEHVPSFQNRQTIEDVVYDQILIALAEAHKSEQESVLEANRRLKAEKDAIDAIEMVKHLEKIYSKEVWRRKEAEIELAKARAELGKARSSFETRIAESDRKVSKLQHDYSVAKSVLQRFLKERDELHAERDRAVKDREEMRRYRAESSVHREVPHCFFCPILKDIMEDPQVAADGFTYEAEAIRQWFGRGHATSPMTNKKLPHTGLVPNRALRSAIQEWLQLGKPSRQAP